MSNTVPVPSPSRRLRLAILIATGATVVMITLLWLNRTPTLAAPNSNSIMVIAPYVDAGTWVFDDASAGLRKEPFVAGVPEMIDALVVNIPEARNGFRLLFSAQPFPGHQKVLSWTRSDGTGNYYKLSEPPLEGWICPALFRYYSAPPQQIYVKAEPLMRSPEPL